MRILHFIQKPNRNNAITLAYTAPLVEQMSQEAEVRVAKGGLRDFLRAKKGFRPDVVHIHAMWSVQAWLVMKLCGKERIPVVVSMGNGFLPWHIKHAFWREKIWKMLFFQHKMIRLAAAVHVRDNQQKRCILSNGWLMEKEAKSAWNTRIAQINDIAPNRNSKERMTSEMLALYVKVINSNPFVYMPKEEVQAVNTLLSVGLYKGVELGLMSKEEKSRLATMIDHNWQRMALHAADEGVFDILKEGAWRVGQTSVITDFKSIPRFRAIHSKALEPLEDVMSTNYKRKAERLRRNYQSFEVERSIVLMLLEIKRELKHGTLSKLHLLELYKALKYKDYNESTLLLIAKRQHLLRFLRRLLGILVEAFSLEEGFCPTKTKNDRKTKMIKNKLFLKEVL